MLKPNTRISRSTLRYAKTIKKLQVRALAVEPFPDDGRKEIWTVETWAAVGRDRRMPLLLTDRPIRLVS